MYLIDDDLRPDIHNLDIREILLVCLAVKSLIDLLVIADPVPEIESRSLWIGSLIIWRRRLDLEDVRHDQVLVITTRLDEQCLDVMLLAFVVYPAAPVLGGIGRVEDCDCSVFLLEPFDHIIESSLCCRASHPLSLAIVRIEEVGSGLRGIISSIGAYVEDLCVD